MSRERSKGIATRAAILWTGGTRHVTN
jgi:hypothetical protein